jgi:prophage regulatory protein
MSPTIQRLAGVKRRTALGRSSIYAAVKAGTFPAPVQLGPRAVGWLDSDITAWIESRPTAGNAVEALGRGTATMTTAVAVRKKKPATAPTDGQVNPPAAEIRRLLGVA